MELELEDSAEVVSKIDVVDRVVAFVVVVVIVISATDFDSIEVVDFGSIETNVIWVENPNDAGIVFIEDDVSDTFIVVDEFRNGNCILVEDGSVELFDTVDDGVEFIWEDKVEE